MKLPLVARHLARPLAAVVVLAAAVDLAAAQEPGALEYGPVQVAPTPEAELARGRASWYGGKFHGRLTSSGERFDMNELTAAHTTLKFGTRVRVRNVTNGREIVVRINDRGPHIRTRIIDLSKAAAAALGFLHAGEASVVLMKVLTRSECAAEPSAARTSSCSAE